jgi:hypothetical protein
MRIDPDVRAVAKDFGLDPQLLQAVVKAEGNILKAVQCSVPSVKTRAAALRILARSAVHALNDYVRANSAAPFIAFWAARWAPVGATNDPKGLNIHWASNVAQLWGVTPPPQKV